MVITLPSGRIVWGDLYTPNDKDIQGNQRTYQSGANKGQPRATYDFGVAIPKTPGITHWANEPEWGQAIWAIGHQVSPQAQQIRDFAWKVKDGDDSSIPPPQVGRQQAKPLNQREGYPGHWIISMSSNFPPTIYDGTNNLLPLPQKDHVKAGDYVQVRVSIEPNSSAKPGVFINPNMVCFAGFGKRISQGGDPTQAGFKLGVAAGASAAPVGGMPVGTVPAAAPAAPAAPVTPMAPPPVPAAMTTPPAPAVPVTPPAPAPVAAPPVAPSAAFMPAPPAAPAVPAAPPSAPQRTMTAKAAPYTYEQFKGMGWTDEQLIQNGMMLP